MWALSIARIFRKTRGTKYSVDGGIKIPGEGRSQGPAGVRTMVILDIELKARRNIHFRSSAADNE